MLTCSTSTESALVLLQCMYAKPYGVGQLEWASFCTLALACALVMPMPPLPCTTFTTIQNHSHLLSKLYADASNAKTENAPIENPMARSKIVTNKWFNVRGVLTLLCEKSDVTLQLQIGHLAGVFKVEADAATHPMMHW